MGKYEKLLLQILTRASEANIAFLDLCELMRRLGFEERIRGSHHLFRKDGVEERINFQREGNKAKVYKYGKSEASF